MNLRSLVINLGGIVDNASFGGFQKWWYHKIGALKWKILLKWMITRGTPMTQETSIWGLWNQLEPHGLNGSPLKPR